jgi:hypothetical protein
MQRELHMRLFREDLTIHAQGEILMAKFHINNSGESGNCRAEKGGCPFGGEEQHYSSAAEAGKAYESKMADQVVPEPVEREGVRERPLPKPEALPEAKKSDEEEMKSLAQKMNEVQANLRNLGPGKYSEATNLQNELQVLSDAYWTIKRSQPEYQKRMKHDKIINLSEDIRKLESNIRHLSRLAYEPRQKGESRAAYKERMRIADGPENMPSVTRTSEFYGITEREPIQDGYKIQIEKKTAKLRKMQDEFDVLEGREPAADRPPLVATPKKAEGGLRGFFSRF